MISSKFICVWQWLHNVRLPSCLAHRQRSALLVFAVLVLLPPSVARTRRRAAPLAARIDTILQQTGANRGFWGIEVARLPDGELLYTRNGNRLFQPASNMKLFTTAAALAKLGPDFIFRTTVESTAPADAQGRVPDLILVGRGDPNLGGRVLPYYLKAEERSPADIDFQNLADQVVQKGVREVTGDLVADTSYYVEEPFEPEWAVDDMVWGYGAPVTALAFNGNCLKLHFAPGPTVGSEATVTLDPIPGYYRLVTGVKTSSAGEPEKLTIERAPGSMELDIGGQIPLGSGGTDALVAVQDPPQLIGEMFRHELEQRGVKIDGSVVIHRLTPLDAAGEADGVSQPAVQAGPRAVLAEHDSLPLREDVKVTLKVSQNLHAEMLLRTLAHQVRGVGSLEGGLEILRDFARGIGIAPDAIYFSGGSGLSRNTLVTPEALIDLLKFMSRSPDFQDFYDALPISGVDGTLADRFQNTIVEGRIHAKTGTLEHVNTLSGYMDLPGGRRLAFAIMSNNQSMESAEINRAIDKIALQIYRSFAPASRSR